VRRLEERPPSRWWCRSRGGRGVRLLRRRVRPTRPRRCWRRWRTQVGVRGGTSPARLVERGEEEGEREEGDRATRSANGALRGCSRCVCWSVQAPGGHAEQLEQCTREERGRGARRRIGSSHLVLPPAPPPQLRLAQDRLCSARQPSASPTSARTRPCAAPTPSLPPLPRSPGELAPPPSGSPSSLDTRTTRAGKTHLAHRLGLVVSPERLVRHRLLRLGRPHGVAAAAAGGRRAGGARGAVLLGGGECREGRWERSSARVCESAAVVERARSARAKNAVTVRRRGGLIGEVADSCESEVSGDYLRAEVSVSRSSRVGRLALSVGALSSRSTTRAVAGKEALSGGLAVGPR